MMDSTTKRRLGLVVGLGALTLGGYALTQLPERLAAQPWVPAVGTSAAIDAPTPSGPTVAPVVGDAVTLSATPDRRAVLRGGDGLVHVKLELSADAIEGAIEARPTDMLVVLDVSGSMSGDKLAHAKQALERLIERLSPQDRLSLVTYEDGASTPIPFTVASRENKAAFRRVVRQLATGGGTNMSAGLDLALEALQQRRHGAHPPLGNRAGRSTRVLLLSDGHANQGDATPRGLARRARQIVQLEDVMSTMGVGDDFNEDLMTSLADTGTGNFYYLSRVETMGRFFDAELRAASETVASAVELRFTPEGGTRLLDVGGYPIAQSADHFSVRPGNLYGGQTRTLWATLRVPTASGGVPSVPAPVPVGAFSVRYKRADRHQSTPPLRLPALARVAEQAAFDAAIVASVWEDYVAGEAYMRAQTQLGAAVSEGDAADVDRVHLAYEKNRALATRLGNARVLQQVRDMRSKSATAKEHQKKSTRERKYRGKQMKARSLFKRRADAYNDDPLRGL